MKPARPENGSGLPAPYEDPWRRLAVDLRAVAAASRLKLRELWRRNREGELPRPGFWPASLGAIFWPLLLALLLGLISVAVVGLTRQASPAPGGPGAIAPAAGSGVQPRPSGGEGMTGSPEAALAAGAEAPRPPAPESLSPAPADPIAPEAAARAAEAPSQDAQGPAGRLTLPWRRGASAPSPESPAAGGPSVAHADDGARDDASAPEQTLAGAAPAAPDQPPAAPAPPSPDPQPLLEALIGPEPPAWVLGLEALPAENLLRLRLAAGFSALADRERRSLSEAWLARGQALGYERLELLSPSDQLLARSARVGSGMILLDPSAGRR